MEKQSILEVRNLTKSYGNYVVLKNISFLIEKGTIIGLLGKNGAGKTTLMKTILGLLCEYDGEIFFDKERIKQQDRGVMGRISSLVDVKFYEDLTAYQNLNYLLLAYPNMKKRERRKKIRELLEMVGLEGNSNDKVKSFSFGMKQRLALAQVFTHEGDLLILDEPFVGLDPVGMEEMKKVLKNMRTERGVSIIFSSHQLDEVGDLADKIVAIIEGTIKYCGTLSNLQNESKKYSIWFSGEKEAVVIPYEPDSLQAALKEGMQKGRDVERIEIMENGLYRLFI